MRVQTFVSMSAAVAAVGVVAASASATPPAQSFGVLNYNGTPGGNIPFTVGTGGGANIGNDGFYFSNHSAGAGTVTIGLKAIAWQGANFDLANDVSYSSVAGGGSWLKLLDTGVYGAGAGAATETRDGSGNIIPYTGATRARWSFVWNASFNGARPAAGLFNLRMIVDGPTAGPALSMDLGDLNANFSTAADPVWQNAWNVGFNFLSSQGAVTDVGNWNINLQVFDRTVGDGYTTLVGQQAINVAVPAPGAIALLGAAGLLGSRRRRS